MPSVRELPREDQSDCRKISKRLRRMVIQLLSPPPAARGLRAIAGFEQEAPLSETARRSRAVVA
jgi:hypothetical protein